MPIFIDSLPLHDPQPGSAEPTWYPLLPAILTERGASFPALDQCRPWKFDSGNALEALGWRFHLEQAGIDPDQRRDPARLGVRTANWTADSLSIRRASLWLVSNIPSLRASPFQVDLGKGFTFYDRVPPAQEGTYPLLGMRALRRAGLRVFIDGVRGTISVWVPGGWLRSAGTWLRRLPGRFTTCPLDELCPTPWW
jgi:hypothetical protein